MALNEEDLQEYTLKDFRQNLTQIIGEVIHAHKRIRVTSYGRVAGYFIPVEDMAVLEAVEEREDIQAVEAYRSQGKNRTLIPIKTVKEELGL